MGVLRTLLMCDKSNVASARVIIRNGGVFESEEYMPKYGDVVQRYWINLVDPELR
jgi:predicted acetyltransferase